MSYIQFINTSKSFGDISVVNNVNLEIQQGDFVSLLGPSGCGKTTCLRMLAGLEKNSSGQIKLDGQVVSDPQHNIFVAPEYRKLGMVFQSYAVWPHMNVFANIAFPLKMAGERSALIEQKVNEVIGIVELSGLALRMPNELSGGQQQRVALARGLVMNPKALLLDEPLSNLDTKLREKMRADIKTIQKRLNLTMIYVTHDQTEAKSMSDVIVVMNNGEVLQAGTPQEIYNNPANEFVADFVR